MNSTKRKDTKEQYERIVKIVEKAEKAAKKFVQKNMQMDARLQIKYS